MRSISTKMVLAFIGIGVISIAVISVIARWNTRTEFIRFLSDQTQTGLITDLSEYHRTNKSWAGVDAFFAPGMNHMRPGHGPGMMQPFTLADEYGTVLISNVNYDAGDPLSRADLDNGVPITEDDKVIGILVHHRMPFEGNPREVEFIETTNRTLLYAALAGAVIALLLGIFLSRTLTRPIHELTRATHAVSQGDLSQQVTIHSNDELGELALAFNKMSTELLRSINARKQMTADIAHELRTPLSLILGHAEAVHDGVLPPTRENFEIIREEAVRLEQLVNDLRTLSLADAGELVINLQPVEPARLVQEVVPLYRYQTQKKNISLELDLASPLSTLEADPGRMTQVLTNILDNALRHTPEGGAIVLSARQRDEQIEITIQDSGPGLPREELERIFERFYRTDSSRQREDGGSGLGLAIAKSIVQAHGGQVSAESEAGRGLKVIITLPGTS
ncbi:MAG TPA: ATP-binding protein [Anaerolineales bacterium]|nr:ATP-binding protein [Anaerolineales bacterium]